MARRSVTERYAPALRFGGAPTIGDIATGRVKAVVDCLYPLRGGVAGKPDDWRITAFRVEQASPGVPNGAVAIAVHAAP